MLRRLPYIITAIVTILLCAQSARADKLEKFLLRAGIYEMDDSTGYREVDSVEVTLTRADTVSVPFKLLTAVNDSTPLSKSDLRLLVDGGRGTYQLRLYKEGFQPKLHEVRVTAVSHDVVWAGSVQMRRESNVMLDGIEVRATAIKMVMKGDTIVYNADAFNVAEGSMLEALVRMFPGATISPEGQIKINGRVINELLINGKDFFTGDPNVALKNLPAYTVKQAKVYDKAADDAYLTHSDAKLARREDEENLVMDIHLKKEYNRGMLANVEAGYGTHNRYIGRLFGLMFTQDFRLSAFGNFNNIKDISSASTDGYWNNSWSSPGLKEVQKGGFDYLYDKDRWRSSGNVTVTNETPSDLSKTASIQFYPTGDTYTRSDARSSIHSLHFSVRNETQYKGDDLFLNIKPAFEFSHNSDRSVNRSATFSQQPEEHSRGESLDSLFAGHTPPPRFERWLMYRNGTISLGRGRYLRASLPVNVTIRPPEMRGMLNVNLWGNHSRRNNQSRNIYNQVMGPQTPADVQPTRRDSYADRPQHDTNAGIIVRYTYDHTTYTDTRKRTWRFIAAGHYEHTYTRSVNDYWLASDPDVEQFFREDVALPSVTSPANAIIDTTNTYSTDYHLNLVHVNTQIQWSTNPIAPTDSGINPSFSALLDVTNRFNHKQLLRVAPDNRQGRAQRTDYLQPNLTLSFNSTNKVRNVNLSLYYGLSRSYPDIANLLNYTTSTNPFHVTERGMESLRPATTHTVNFRLNYFSRTERSGGLMFYATCSSTTDAFGQTKRYDPATGISYYRSVNVDGNINTSANMNWWVDLGPAHRWSISGYTYGSYAKSIDFVTATSGEPEKSLVHTVTATQNLGVSYTLANGSNFSLNANGNLRRATSPRSDFTTIKAGDFGGSFYATVRLPANMELRSSLTYTARRGYSDPNMNTDEWLWNASASWSILKGDLTFKVSADDILGQITPISWYVNAQGRYETWSRTLPHHVMFSVRYRFRHNPRKVDDAGIFNNF